MNKTLADAMDAHGGLERWKKFVSIEMDFDAKGQLLEMKKAMSPGLFHIVVGLQEQATWTTSASAPDKCLAFRPDRMAIESSDGKLILERHDPRTSFDGHTRTTPWDTLHRGYFSGYAIWCYYNVPFILAMKEAQVWDIDPLEDEGELLRGIAVILPSRFATHSRVQEFYFDKDMLIRRQDYTLDIADAPRIAHYALDNVDVDGFKVPTKRRAYLCNKRYEVQRDKLYISMDLSNFRLNDRRHFRF